MKKYLPFLALSSLAGIWFFYSLNSIWPLADVSLHIPSSQLESQARAFLIENGFEMTGYHTSSRLRVESDVMDYLEARLSQEAVQEVIRNTGPLIRYQVFFKKRGEPRIYSIAIHPGGQITGWNSGWREEKEGAFLDPDRARTIGEQSAQNGLKLDISDWLAKGATSRDLPNRRRHVFTYERLALNEPELRERLQIIVEGEIVAGAIRSLIVPESARLEARADEAPRQTLQLIGFVLLGLAGIAALAVFLLMLQQGKVRLKQAAWIASITFILGMSAQFLQDTALFLEWDPLWPRYTSLFQSLFTRSALYLQIFLLVLVLIAAGDALDRESGAERGNSFWFLAKGRLFHHDVARDCGLGFMLGLICGAVLTLGGYWPVLFSESYVSIQPRGFFFYVFNASSPTLATLCFFLGIALIEEGGYRYFAGTWLMKLTKKPWIAIVVPGIIYGLTHTALPFLPPAEPFWARPLVLTLVGCVWGWGYLRFGALTVIISHFTADLFIFNWPRLASGEIHLQIAAVFTILVPLIPVLGLMRRRQS